jgi:DNA-binding CsgD family transcriptional regulator/N-acetylneuraminic acid mutarotase
MAEPREPLTERELEIVRLVGTGMGNKEIAAQLFLSPNTVKVHLRNIFTKLEAKSRTEVTTIAIRNGWILLELAAATIDQQPAGVDATTVLEQKAASALPGKSAEMLPVDHDQAGLPSENQTIAVVDKNTSFRVVPVAPNPLPLPSLQTWQRTLLLVGIVAVFALIMLTIPASQGNASGSFDPLRISPSQPHGGLLSRGEASRWYLRAPLPVARARSAAVAVGSLVYIIGGEVNQTVSGDVLVFAPISDTWTIMNTPKPTPVANAGASSVGDRIYVAGGTSSDGKATTAFEVYNTVSLQWQKLAPLPTPLAGHAFAAFGRQLFLFGGTTDNGITNAAWRYDIDADAWHPISPMTSARSLAAAATLNDRIYVVGGYNEGHELANCEYYTPAQDVWNTCQPLDVPRGSLGLAKVGTNLFAVGGGVSGFMGFNERYDPVSNRWTALETPLTSDWQNVAVASGKTEFYVFGGYSNGERLAFTYVYEVFSSKVYLPTFQTTDSSGQGSH